MGQTFFLKLGLLGWLLMSTVWVAQAREREKEIPLNVRLEVVGLETTQEPGNAWQKLMKFLGIRKLAVSRPAVGTKLKVSSTAYAPSPYQTDATPCITASGSRVRRGTIATNILPFGTLVKINGDLYIVEDRMNPRYGNAIDIFFPSTSEALKYGSQKLEIEIVGYGQVGQELVLPDEPNVEIAITGEPVEAPAVQPNVTDRILGSLSNAWRTYGTLVGIRKAVDVDRYDVDCFGDDVSG